MPRKAGSYIKTCYIYIGENIMQNHYDFTPFYKNSIGVDRLMETLNSRLNANHGNYPPYNIISTSENTYIIELAIAGFTESDINITAHNGKLTVTGEIAPSGEIADADNPLEPDVHYLHHGISNRKFNRDFQLSEYVVVQDANLNNGILIISLERVIPDSQKPKEIKINIK
jgi:molecular chaperone IbpA